jgi:hypothetical protein
MLIRRRAVGPLQTPRMPTAHRDAVPLGTCVTRGAPDGTAARSSRLRCSTLLSSLASTAGARMVTVGSFRSAGRSMHILAGVGRC